LWESVAAISSHPISAFGRLMSSYLLAWAPFCFVMCFSALRHWPAQNVRSEEASSLPVPYRVFMTSLAFEVYSISAGNILNNIR
jgi:hypothetical protein